jgi:hypothetical protein
MASNPEIRSRYLALALDTRKVIDALIQFVDKGTRKQDFNRSLQEAIESLRGVSRKTDIFSPSHNRLAFSKHYEQAKTVQEALRPADRSKIVKKLASIKSKKADKAKLREDAYEAIKLLSAIESRALYHYRPQP